MWSRVSKGKVEPSLLVLQLEYPPERLRLMLKNVDWHGTGEKHKPARVTGRG